MDISTITEHVISRTLPMPTGKSNKKNKIESNERKEPNVKIDRI